MAFDTGWNDRAIFLDSTFVAAHSFLIPDTLGGTSQIGSAWANYRVLKWIYNTPKTVKIGNTTLTYDGIQIFDWKKAFQTNDSEGILNIPQNDTTNIWEWNFEHNYLEIHPAENFKIPKNSFVFPMTEKSCNPNIQIPLQIKCANEDTLTINRTFFVDMGMPQDIVLMHPTKDEFDFFNKRDAVWTDSFEGYSKRYTVTGTLFNHFIMDSLRIYTFSNPHSVKSEYLIGQNFIKRFNVFIDRKNWQIGLQPIKNFQRIVNPNHRRFHFSTHKTPEGKFIVNKLANYEQNYYKTAGLQENDEILNVNGKPYKDIIYEEKQEFYQKDTLVYDVIRNGRILKIVVLVDKNEEQGD
jgi:hypothetical protein